MDLRTRKTLRSLRGAFLELRRNRPLECITVRELCERAEVSKATFYLHYHSIYELLRELQRKAVQRIVNDIGDPGELFNCPAKAARELFASFTVHHVDMDSLFSHGQEHILAESLEEELRRRLPDALLLSEDGIRLDALLTYLVEGGYHAYMRFARGATPDVAAKVVSTIAMASEAVVGIMYL